MIKPIYDNVVLKIEEEKDVIDLGSGIQMKKAVGQKTQDTGVVVATGVGRIAISGSIVPLIVKKGDKVIFNKFAGTEVTSEGELYIIIKESDILAVL